MIHIKDLAEFVKRTVERPPISHYLFAIDYNKKPTQKSIVKAIAAGVGTGKARQISIESIEETVENQEVFLLDVRMRPSKAFIVNEEENEENEDNEENEEKKEKFKFCWHCKEGLQKNIAKINNEFNGLNSLKSNRIFINGPPACGKSFFGKKIAEFYNIPHIMIKDLVEKSLELVNI